MYIRVKAEKKNQTIFLYTDPTELLSEVRKKLAHLSGVPDVCLQLFTKRPDGNRVYDCDRSVSDNKIENDNIVFMEEGTSFSSPSYTSKNNPLFSFRLWPRIFPDQKKKKKTVEAPVSVSSSSAAAAKSEEGDQKMEKPAASLPGKNSEEDDDDDDDGEDDDGDESDDES